MFLKDCSGCCCGGNRCLGAGRGPVGRLTVFQPRCGGGLHTVMAVGGEKWTEKGNQDMGREGVRDDSRFWI